MFLPQHFLAATLGVQMTGFGASLVSLHSAMLLLPGGQCGGSHIGSVQILLAGLCAILPRISPQAGNKNVSFSQIYLVLILVLYIRELTYI